MRRPLSYLAVSAFVAGMAAFGISAAPAAPQAAPSVGQTPHILLVAEDWGGRILNQNREQHGYYGFSNGYERRNQRRDIRPGFFFPFAFQPPRRDCYRGYDGRLYCAR